MHLQGFQNEQPLPRGKTLKNYFINAHFTYCPLIWMFSSKGCYKRINKILKRTLKLILNGYELSFDSLRSTLNEKTIHQPCINVLLTEVYKYLNRYFSDLMNLRLLLAPKSLQLT